MGETRPWLYSFLKKPVPFEHVVIPLKQQHPELQDEVMGIVLHAKASMAGVAHWGAVILSGFNEGSTILAGSSIAASSLAHGARRGYVGLKPQQIIQLIGSEEDYLKSMGELSLHTAGNMVTPYVVPSKLTKNLPKVIREISEDGESPFNRQDAPEILRNYHYGVVDNLGNLILLKHPLDTKTKPLKGLDVLKKMFLWKQPFQRTRFELNKPRLRKKAPAPTKAKISLKPALGMNVALAPVRIK